METQEIKIDGVVYVPHNSKSCNKCALKGKKCGMGYADGENICVCVVFNGRALTKRRINYENRKLYRLPAPSKGI